MPKLRRILPALTLVCVCAGGPVRAQFLVDRQTIRVEVEPVAVLNVVHRSINLRFTQSDLISAHEPVFRVEDDRSSLVWRTNHSLKKITVSSNLPSPQFSLDVEAVDATHGTAAGGVPVSSVPQDLLFDIGRSAGRATLRYTLTAAPEDGVGSEVSQVTFTITDQ